MKDEFDGTADPIRTTAPPVEKYEWINKKTGESHMVPVGIDPGFDYNPGAAPWGNQGAQ